MSKLKLPIQKVKQYTTNGIAYSTKEEAKIAALSILIEDLSEYAYEDTSNTSIESLINIFNILIDNNIKDIEPLLNELKNRK